MERKESEEELMETLNLHSSVNFFTKKNTLSLEGGEEEKRLKYRKRSSSMSIMKIPKNFVPKLKPIKTVICPSPINLNQKAPIVPIPEIQSTTISTASFDSQNDLNQKPIKCIYSRKRKPKKKSFKFLNIEEETYAMSDKEDNSKNICKIYSDSDTSKSEEEDNNITNYKKINILNNINLMREKMTKIKRNSIYNDNLFDDSNIDNHYLVKSLGQYKNICHPKDIIKMRKNHNMNLNRLRSMKIRTKSFSIKQRYVPTILGFLEKSSSANSLNSNDK
jgi:hypothetical protein